MEFFSELLKYLLRGNVEILFGSFQRPSLLWLQNEQSWCQNISIITLNVCNLLVVEVIKCNVQGVKKNSVFVMVVKHLEFLFSILEKFSHFCSTHYNLMTYLYLPNRKNMSVSEREFNYSIPKTKLMLDSLDQEANCQKHHPLHCVIL